jgi:hypothetical protein
MTSALFLNEEDDTVQASSSFPELELMATFIFLIVCANIAMLKYFVVTIYVSCR